MILGNQLLSVVYLNTENISSRMMSEMSGITCKYHNNENLTMKGHLK